MKIFRDYQGESIRLTEERRMHILEHPEMKGMLKRIKETLFEPQRVIQSLSDKDANLYYRFYIGTKVGDKYLCVVVKMFNKDAFVLTAYLTDSIKKGEIIWLRK
ncbi:MAG TPA: PBECR2 nuclease fold domain-containing protein [Candidatus Omnitrophota bacterium]|nr:PBECR2 nuclease fold domain-containing protein [Candidatus Omnitrophota bacterium]